MDGVFVIDKPAGLTSHDVVSRARRILAERSIGHLGTLDPMATGVLPLVVGRMTRLAQFFAAVEKRYEGEIRLGFATTTYDAEGEALGESGPVGISMGEIEAVGSRFRGAIEQKPPPFSAKKIGGVPAYKLARRQQPVALAAVPVHVYELELGPLQGELLGFRARVSSGTYLRSIAHELGAALGVGGHLHRLRRTAAGEFSLADALTLDALEERRRSGTLAEAAVHPRRLLPEFPAVTANEESEAAIRNGRPVNLPDFSRAKYIKVFRGQTELIAIAARIAGTLFQPKVVLSGKGKS
ncbi:MAG: tRNA pseudouridine(55) synthase TruB [Acidobacteria bacterium]|nr:tRNA pseudouridine(55) synthase TruB [Acidobacteriota bacterium]